MNWKKWKLGFCIACGCGLLSAGASLVDGMHWRAFVAVLCTSLLTNLLTYLKDHPVEAVKDGDTTTISKPPGTIGLWLLALGLSLTLLFSGCAGTSAQRVLLVSSSTAATTVNAAYDLWGADALAKVKQQHPEATAAQRVDLLLQDSRNADVVQLYDDWRSANLLWSAVNQTAASGTNAAAVLEASNLRMQLANVGNKLLRLVSELTGKPQPVLTP